MKFQIVKVFLLAAFLLGGTLEANTLETAFSNWWKGISKAPAVKVLIVHDQPGAVLEVKGKYKIFDPYTGNFLSTRVIGKRRFIQPLSDGLKWGEEFPGIHQIEIVPDDVKTTIAVDGVEYKGALYVYDIGGTISIVNEVPLEDYLKILLTPQFEKNLPSELAAAIAITARTNTWHQVQNGSSTYWSIDASKVGYQGSAAAAAHTDVSDAINATRNMILVKEGVTFPAEWGSSAGGAGKDAKPTFARISFFEAEELAKKGNHADKILNEAFPDSTVSLIQ